MKSKAIIGLLMLISVAMLWRCSDDKNEFGNSSSLKESLNAGASDLNQALDKITQSSGFKMLVGVGDDVLKTTADDTVIYADSILLSEIKGIYEYKTPDNPYWCMHCFYRLFEKTGESDQMIVQLPEAKVFHPRYLQDFSEDDTTQVNNFRITASDYHYYIANGFVHDYKLNAGFDLDDVSIGNLIIQSDKKSWQDYFYRSVFTFAEGYQIEVNNTSGDTAQFSISLRDDADILLKESVAFIKNEKPKHRDREYTLTIGNVTLMNSTATDSMMVYLNGVLQANATVEVIDIQSDSIRDYSVCHKRDILITFDDGTVTKVSELIGPSLEILGTLVDSIMDMNFATRVVDYIAWNIHMSNKKGYN